MDQEKSKKKTHSRKPAHQNTYAFKHNKNSALTKKIEKIPVSNLCRRCTEKILWRKQYRKYKVQNHLSRCTVCQEKAIPLAYNIVCDPCGSKTSICRMCRTKLTFATTAPLAHVLKSQAASKDQLVGQGLSVDQVVDQAMDQGVIQIEVEDCYSCEDETCETENCTPRINKEE
ncbi:hypothetical protein NEDG_00450 [Nematocida displodere]|uniref:Uncharacterized protein n=1 Tax=Nematocida displodere TaxID=1805483 RepID=A0A177EJ40_9MICR|nr:hypothetical protein NEDG_00450 [Nematocida displodere]